MGLDRLNALAILSFALERAKNLDLGQNVKAGKMPIKKVSKLM